MSRSRLESNRVEERLAEVQAAWYAALVHVVHKDAPLVKSAVLVGSHARGEAHQWSDIDVLCIGQGEENVVTVSDFGPVIYTFGTFEQHQARMLDPALCAQVVPAWRQCKVLYDSSGEAKMLRDFALEWSWDMVSPRPEAWAAKRISGFGEEALKLCAAMRMCNWTNARVQASLLALYLAPAVATGTRMLFTSENYLWNLVAEQVGLEWRQSQAAALAADGENPAESSRAAIHLYLQASHLFYEAMNQKERAFSDFVEELCTRALEQSEV